MSPQELSLKAFVTTYALSISIDLGRSLIEGGLNFLKDKRKPTILGPDLCAFILPCHNSGDFLAKTIESLPKIYKLYCVANACSDGTEDVIAASRATLIKTEIPGKIQAVLLGALQAQKDGYTHFVLLDDDIIWPKNEKGEDTPLTTYDPDVGCTALPVIPSLRCPNWITYNQYIEYSLMVISKRGQSILGNVIMASGAAGIFRIDNFLKAMTLHDGEHVGDDLQTSFIFHVLGYKIDFNSALVIKTEPPETLASWWRQRTKRWEPSPIFNFIWHIKIIFALSHGAGWWIRAIAFYRIMVLYLDVMRLVTIPFVLFYRPEMLVGVLVIVYCSLVVKLLVFKRYFKKDTVLRRGTLLTYPVYGLLCWFSRLFSLPRGLHLFWKNWVLKRRRPLVNNPTQPLAGLS